MRANDFAAQVAVSEQKRSDVESVCREGRWFAEFWGAAADAEREVIMQGMVKRGEMVTKEEGTCLVAVTPQVPFYNLELTDTQKVAGEVIAINPPLLTTHTFPPVELDYDILRPKRATHRRNAANAPDDVIEIKSLDQIYGIL